MKRMKKVLATLLALAMVLGMSLTVFAGSTDPVGDTTQITGTKPAPGDTGVVKVTGNNIKKDDVEFKAYQIIEPIFDKSGVEGFAGYRWVSSTTGKNTELTYDSEGRVVGLTVEEITDIAAKVDSTTGTTPVVAWKKDASNKDVAELTLGVGTWLIIASAVDDVDVVYNPMVGSVYYTSQTGVDVGDINADTNIVLMGTTAYMKSTDFDNENDKRVGELDENGQFKAAQANAQVGNDVPYVLNGLIPSYSAEYFATVSVEENGETKTTTRTVTYTLNDAINGGLQYNGNVTVFVGGTKEENKVTAGADTYAVKYFKDNAEVATAAEANRFQIVFASDYVEGLVDASEAGRKVVVTYTAKITSNAVSQVAQNDFDVTYTRVPGGDGVTTDSKTVYSYTAAINGLFGKVSENGTTALPGATFTLYDTKSEVEGKVSLSGKVGEALSADTTGNLVFVDDITKPANEQLKVGLEFDKTYYIKETVAPTNYSINETIYEVVCTYDKDKTTTVDPEFDSTTGKLTKYVVSIKNTNSDTSKEILVDYGASATEVLAKAEKVVNTKLNSLPSTGGIGTTIFTIGGVAIMVVAAGLFFVSRRKSAK